MKIALLLALLILSAAWSQDLPPQAQALWFQSQRDSRHAPQALALQPRILPTEDGRSFFLVWQPNPHPRGWIVSLHGAGFPPRGFASDDLVAWAPHLRGRNLGLICLQWWMGEGQNFYAPQEIYREIDGLLQKMAIQPQSVLLHGFSRGATQTYALTALDRQTGNSHFALCVANAGGLSPDYPPNQQLMQGAFGPRPLQSSRWITVAGHNDPNPNRDGIPAMQATGRWLQQQGAQLLEQIEDPALGHGAFHQSRENVRRVLDHFEKILN